MSYRQPSKHAKCYCGENHGPHDIWELVDARGIGCGYVCDLCEEKKKKQYRADVFEDSQYHCDEAVDPEDYY